MNGLIRQWDESTSSEIATLSYPIAFQTAPKIFMSIYSTTTAVRPYRISGITSTNFQYHFEIPHSDYRGENIKVFYVAIGY